MQRRGGWCFEMNGLFAWALRELGFQVTLLGASVVRAGAPPKPQPDHLVLEVDLERPYLADVGFGDGLLEPLPLEPTPLEAVSAQLRQLTGRDVTTVAGDGRALRRVAWCTGGAQGYFEAAIAAGADVFITGEISEPQAHYARETGVAFIAAGHHATERYGVQGVGEHLASELGLDYRFIDVPNPA